MRILITGGAGFIASHITDRYIADGHDVIVVDDLSTGKLQNLNSKAEFHEIQIQSALMEDVFRDFRPEIINHHAAHIDLRKSVIKPIYDAQTNIIGSLNLLSLAAKYEVKKIIFASTGGAIYGEPETLPVDEHQTPLPLSPYGVNKMMVEHYLRVWHSIYNIDYTVLRYPNVYGPRQDPNGEAGVIAIFCLKLLNNETPVIFGDGTKTRDYIYVEDVVRANVLALKKGSRKVLNLGWGQEISDMDVFLNVNKAFGSEVQPKFDEVRPGEVMRISLNAAAAAKNLDWIPKIPFQDGVKMAFTFYKERYSK